MILFAANGLTVENFDGFQNDALDSGTMMNEERSSLNTHDHCYAKLNEIRIIETRKLACNLKSEWKFICEICGKGYSGENANIRVNVVLNLLRFP